MKAKPLILNCLHRPLVRALLPLGLFCAFCSPALADLTHRYSFTTDASDSVGGANGTLQGNVTIVNGAASFPGLTNGDYVQLPPGLISNYTSATFEFWVDVGANGTWEELYAFGNQDNGLGANMVMFTPHSGPGDFRMSYAQADPGFNDEHFTTGPGILDNLGALSVACVYDPPNNIMTLYTNGVRVSSLSPVTTGAKGFSFTNVYNVNSWLGRSLYNGDAPYAGTIDEFRIYNNALGPLQIYADNVAGPGTVLTNVPITSFVWNVVTNLLYGERRDTSVTFNTVSYGTVTLPGATEVSYSSSASNVVAVTKNGRLLALSAGSATLSASYGTTTTSTLVTVSNVPILLHRYSFTADASDSVGGANGTLAGAAFITNGTVVLSGVGSSGTPGDYVDLPNDMFTNITTTSMEVWATDNGSATWARIWDFGNSAGGENTSTGGGDNLFLTTPSGAASLRLAINIGSGEQQLNTTPPSVGSETHIVFVNDAAHNTGYLYVNGALADHNTNMTLAPADMGSTLNDWLGRSQYNDPLFNGSIDEFRIWNGQLSALQVAINTASGPDKIGPSNPGTLVALHLNIKTNMTKGGLQNATLFADFTAVTNVNAAGLGATYTSANTNVATVDVNGVITARAGGSTTITASYSGKNSSQPLTVVEKPTVLAHRYSFSEASGTTVADSVGTANGTISATGVTLGGGAATTDGIAGFIDLPGHLLDGYDAVTFETWVTVNSATLNTLSGRLYEFGSADGVNEVGLTARSGGQNTFLRYFGPTTVSAEQGGNLALDLEFHIVGVFNAPQGTVDLFYNGIWQNSATNVGYSLAAITNTMSRLGATFATNFFTAAAFDEFRIYNGALDLLGIRTSFAAGPSNVVTAPGTPTSFTLGVDTNMVLGSLQLPHAKASFAAVTNVDLTSVSEVTYSSSDPTVVGVTSDNRLQAVGTGTATITASFQTKTATKTVTVYPKQTMLVHRYSFTADASDSVGAQDGTVFGTAQISGNAVVLSGDPNSRESYVDLPSHLVSSYDSVTMEAWVSLGATLGTWARIFDFGNQSAGAGGLSYVFLCPQTGTPSTRVVLSDGITGANEAVLDLGGGSMLDGFSGQIAVVYDPPSNTQFIYTNGVLAGSASLGGKLLSGVNDLHCWLGKSLYAADSGLAATIDEFRIYAGAFTPAQITADFNAGANTVVLPPPVQGSSAPKLTASKTGSNLLMTWPASATGFAVQTSASLGSSASWGPVSATPVLTNGLNEVTVPIGSQAAFFRLKK
jgi:hypothetical protein